MVYGRMQQTIFKRRNVHSQNCCTLVFAHTTPYFFRPILPCQLSVPSAKYVKCEDSLLLPRQHSTTLHHLLTKQTWSRLHRSGSNLGSTELVRLLERVQFPVQRVWVTPRFNERVLLNLSLTRDLCMSPLFTKSERSRTLIRSTHIKVNKQGSKPMNSHATLRSSKQMSFLMSVLILTSCYTSLMATSSCV